MSRTFSSLSGLIAHMEGVARTLPHAEHEALDAVTTDALDKAKEVIGHYQSDPAWAALAKATVEDRTRKGFTPDAPLDRTGGFRDSFERHVEGAHHAAIGTNDPRGDYFEHGTSRMPPRPVLGAVQAQHEHRLGDVAARRVHRHLNSGE